MLQLILKTLGSENKNQKSEMYLLPIHIFKQLILK